MRYDNMPNRGQEGNDRKQDPKTPEPAVEGGVDNEIDLTATEELPDTNAQRKLEEARERISSGQPATSEYETGIEGERQRILEVIREHGSSIVDTSLPGKYSPSGYSGFATVPDDRRINRNEWRDTQLMSRDGKERFHDAGVNEVMKLVPDIMAEYENVDVPRKGLMGMMGKTENKSQFKEYRPRRHNEIVSGGTSESAFNLTYEVVDDKMPVYKDSCSNRVGQALRVSIVLPESSAHEVWEHLKKDPEFIREIAKMIMIEKVGVTEEAWSQGDKYTTAPFCPPYEKWAKKEGGLKMYFQEPDDDGSVLNPDRIVSL